MALLTTTKEMSINVEDFHRLLPRAFPDGEIKGRDHNIEVTGKDYTVNIHLSGFRERKIALLSLPVLDAKLVIRAENEQLTHKLLDDFDLAFRRGGG